MQHVIPSIGEDDSDPCIIDASYSQFLGFLGLTPAYEEALGRVAYPKEKIIDFLVSEREIVFDWLTEVAITFQRRAIELSGKYCIRLGQGPLSESSPKDIRATFANIWSPDNSELWIPPERVQEDGRVVSRYIPKDSIYIS
jgi:hypothetical protein